MNKLYTYGYQMGAPAGSVGWMLEVRDWTLVDTRLVPRSRKPEWNKGNLAKLLGGRYRHVEALGNINYKLGGEIALKDATSGIKVVLNMLQDQPVVLLCACWDTASCHRAVVANLVSRECGCEVVHLTREDVQAVGAVPPARQARLFD